MARALTPEEKVRYPWASQITDYVPVGSWRKIGLACSGAGIGILVLGLLIIYVVMSDVHLRNGVPGNVSGWLVVGLSSALLAVGLGIGVVTGIQAWLRQSRRALIWSLAAVLPSLVTLLVWLQLR